MFANHLRNQQGFRHSKGIYKSQILQRRPGCHSIAMTLNSTTNGHRLPSSFLSKYADYVYLYSIITKKYGIALKWRIQ